MDIRLKFKAKRPWEGSSNNEIEDATQVKFKRLLGKNLQLNIHAGFSALNLTHIARMFKVV